MFKQVMALALACAAYVSAPAFAQTQRINPSAAARAAVQPRILIAPDARAALASRLTGERIAPAAITGTSSVSVLAPVVGDPRAPSLSLEIRHGTWITTGDDPRAVISSFGTLLDLRFQMEANARYLVLCDMSRGVQLGSVFGQGAPALTWEGPTRAAILVPRAAEAGSYLIRFTGGGELRSCEVSRIG